MLDIRTILTPPKTIAMVGASNNPERPSHSIMRMLLEAGFKVIPVNPNETEVLGHKAYKSVEDIDEPVDIVNVFRRPAQTPEVAAQAVKIGAKVLWLQLGISHADARKIAEDAGITYIEDRCIAVEYRLMR